MGGPQNQVLLGTGGNALRSRQAYILGGFGGQAVAELQGLEKGAEVMVTVLAFVLDLQAQVYFRRTFEADGHDRLPGTGAVAKLQSARALDELLLIAKSLRAGGRPTPGSEPFSACPGPP